MSESETLCLSCGLCCDGTLIGFVQVSSEEVSSIKQIMEIEEINGQGIFIQPCSKYCNGCTVYENRPKQCGIFKCSLLTAVEDKELEFVVASEVITEVKERKTSLLEKLRPLQLKFKSPSFYFQMVELKKMLKKAKKKSTLSPVQLEIISDLKQLDQILLDKFGITLD